MGHFREAIEKTKTTGELLEVAKTIASSAEAQIFVQEAATYAFERSGGIPRDRSGGEESIREIVCQAASRESPEMLAKMEGLLNYKFRPKTRTVGDLLGPFLGGIGIVVIGEECPGCPNCQPERFDGKTIDAEGYTVSEEPPKKEELRRLLGK